MDLFSFCSPSGFLKRHKKWVSTVSLKMPAILKSLQVEDFFMTGRLLLALEYLNSEEENQTLYAGPAKELKFSEYVFST